MSTSLKCMFKVYGILQLTCNEYITTFDRKVQYTIHWMYMVTHVDALLPSTASRTKTCSRQSPFNESAHFLRAREYTFCWKPCHTRSSSRQGGYFRTDGPEAVAEFWRFYRNSHRLYFDSPSSLHIMFLVWKKNPNNIMFYILPLKDITYSPNKTASAFVLQYFHNLSIDILSISHAFPCFDPELTL